MTDIATAKSEASRLWLARPGVQAIGAEPDGQGGWKLIVYLAPGNRQEPDIPATFRGFPVEQVVMDDRITPLGSG